MLIDTHCHLQFKAYEKDREAVLKRCSDKELIMNVVGTQIDTSLQAIKLAEENKNIYATIGLHPIHLFSTEVDEEESSFKSREEDFNYDSYKKLTQHEKVIGIGECGLELYHLPKNIDQKEALEKQKQIFLKQYELAKEADLPLVIHVRDAHQEMIELLSVIARSEATWQSHNHKGIATPLAKLGARNDSINGVIHCYSSNWENAQKYLDLGLYIGFTGIVTFPPKKTDPQAQYDLLEVIKNCPLDKILIETDAPYLAPQAYRGERCEPWMVEEVVKKLAEIKGLSLKNMSKQVILNSQNLFKKIKI